MAPAIRTTADEAIRLEGFNAFRRALRQSDPALVRQLGQSHKRLATAVFVPQARRLAAGRPFPRPGHAVEGAVSAAATSTAITLVLGARRVPWALGQEFGSNRLKQFPARSPRQGRGNVGYFFYPALRGTIGEMRDVYGDIIDAMMEQLAAKGGEA